MQDKKERVEEIEKQKEILKKQIDAYIKDWHEKLIEHTKKELEDWYYYPDYSKLTRLEKQYQVLDDELDDIRIEQQEGKGV